MNNETIEDQVLGKKKSNSKKTFYIVAGLLVLGIVSLFGGIKILSKLSISADTNTPPVPPDPYSASVTVTSSSTSQPPTPPTPCESTKSFSISPGWSIISGMQLLGKDLSPIAKKGIFIYSYNDPSIPNRDWVISDPNITAVSDYFHVGQSQKFWPQTFLGYYTYNPGAKADFTLDCVTTTNPAGDGSAFNNGLIYGRGWHLMYWSGYSQSRDELLNNLNIFYHDETHISFNQAQSESIHKASAKVYVIVNQSGVSSGSIKELTTSDSATTISKIPANSFFWVYLRRTSSRVDSLGFLSAEISNTSATPSDLPPMPQG